MRHALLGLIVAAFTFSGAISSLAGEILVISWGGKKTMDITFENYVKAKHPGVTFRYIEPDRNKGKLAQALRDTDLSKVDLVYTIGTTASKITKQFLKNKKPMVFGFVSTPVLSNIADSIEKPGKNVSGTAFLVDVKTQLKVLSNLRKIKKMAVWFDPREKQSLSVNKLLKQEAAKLNIDIETFRIIPDLKNYKSSLAEASAKTNKMDALYILHSSSFSGKFRELHSKLDKKLLVFGSLDHYVANGSTVALAADIYERAIAGARIASKILNGTPAGDIPVSQVTVKVAKLYVNKNTKAVVGLKNLDKLGYNVHMIDPEAFRKRYQERLKKQKMQLQSKK